MSAAVELDDVPEAGASPDARASCAVARFLRALDATRTDLVSAHLRDEHRLDATSEWIERQLRDRGWLKRKNGGGAYTWHRPRPEVVDLDAPEVRT